MVSPRTSPDATPILQLLTDYSFDTDDYQIEVMVTEWLQQFEPSWVSQAITEALYQGRYKMVSVDHILQLWQRRGQPLRHFNREFESIILGQAFIYPPGSGKGNPSSSQPLPPRPLVRPDPSEHQVAASSVPSQPQRTIQPLTPAQWERLAQAPTHPPLRAWGVATQSSMAETYGPDDSADDFAPDASELKSLAANTLGPDSPNADRPGLESLDQPETTDFSGAIAAFPGVARSEATPDPCLGADGTAAPTATNPSPPIPNFRPVAQTPAWEAADTIQPFVPQPATSEFHQRLKAVVKAGLSDE